MNKIGNKYLKQVHFIVKLWHNLVHTVMDQTYRTKQLFSLKIDEIAKPEETAAVT